MLDGVNHVATLTQDTDRLVAFYEEVFGAEVVVAEHDGDLRFTAIRLGARTMLNVFELPGQAQPTGHEPAFGDLPMFERGRIDHFGLNVADETAFEALRRRLVDLGATAGEVTDFGGMRSVTFRDPDGMAVELCHWVPGTTMADLRSPDRLRRAAPASA